MNSFGRRFFATRYSSYSYTYAEGRSFRGFRTRNRGRMLRRGGVGRGVRCYSRPRCTRPHRVTSALATEYLGFASRQTTYLWLALLPPADALRNTHIFIRSTPSITSLALASIKSTPRLYEMYRATPVVGPWQARKKPTQHLGATTAYSHLALAGHGRFVAPLPSLLRPSPTNPCQKGRNNRVNGVLDTETGTHPRRTAAHWV